MHTRKSTAPANWREHRRLRAWELHQQGWSQRRIAAELDVTQGAICQWLRRAREGGGVEALRHRVAPGRQGALTAAQLGQIPALIARGAEAFGFRGNEWTTARATTMLEQAFGVSYHPAHVSRLLRRHCPGWRAKQVKRHQQDKHDLKDGEAASETAR